MDFSKMNYDDLFICHSLRLFHELKANGFWYLKKEKDVRSDRFIWIFKRTPELMQVVIKNSNKK